MQTTSSLSLQTMPMLFLLASLLLRSATASSGSNTSCTPETCGNLTIRYPFSLASAQQLYCGYPGFDLACDAGPGQAYLTNTFRERLFRVADIYYANNSMVAAVQTAFEGDAGCPVPDFNVSASLALFPLTISAANNLLVFFYDCHVPPELRLPRSCGNRTMGAYISGLWGVGGEEHTLPPGVSRNCSSVSVPVRGGMDLRRYERLIGDGFLVELPAPLGDCDGCRRMSGECRFDQFSFQCVCPDGNLCPSSNSNKSNSTTRPGRGTLARDVEDCCAGEAREESADDHAAGEGAAEHAAWWSPRGGGHHRHARRAGSMRNLVPGGMGGGGRRHQAWSAESSRNAAPGDTEGGGRRRRAGERRAGRHQGRGHRRCDCNGEAPHLGG